MTDRDYVLGTHDEELGRLGLQHLVWRPAMLEGWRRAGITRGSHVLDVGAGPGYATEDLAEIVGATGCVVGIERSHRFASVAHQRCAERGLTNVRIDEADLMQHAMDSAQFDFAWCRWVACFVSSPTLLVERIAAAIRPGGTAIFHEYGDYASWRLLPVSDAFDAFVAEVMASWRDTGGEPNIGLTLPVLLRASGFQIREVRPLVFTTRPSDFIWQWPATFVRSGLRRLVDLGRVDPTWADSVTREFDSSERDPHTLMLTPLVLEIVATRQRR